VDALTARGREPILGVLSDGMDDAVAGSGRLVLLLGEAGIGKTTMARTLASDARRRGMTVRWSACWAGGATVAHAPWTTLLAGLGPAGRSAVVALRRTGSREAGAPSAAAAERASAYAAVVDALEEGTAGCPALLVLDDLHWADEGTLELLDVVGAHVPALPVLVVATYRDTDVGAGTPLATLGGRAERVELHGLHAAGVAELLSDHLGSARAAELAGSVAALTAGNPFLVVQLARLLAQDPGALRAPVLPTGARDLLHQRLSALAGEDRRVLVAGAVLANPFRARDVADVLQTSAAAVVASLERAAAVRVVERAAGTGSWTFVHDLFRQAALELGEPADVADDHRRAAAILEREGAEPAVIAVHLLAADDALGAAAWSARAGERALAAMAWEEAATHYERALDALPAGVAPEVRADALAGLGRARLLTGDELGATRSFEELAALGRALGSEALLVRAALGFSADLSGFEVRLFDQRQINLLEEAAAALGPTGEPATRATVLARLSVALSLTASEARRLELAEAAVALAREADEPVVLASALAAHCDAIAGPADVGRREAEATEIIAIAEAAGEGAVGLLGRRLRFVARLERGDVAGVDEDMRAFARQADAIGNPLYSWYVPLWKAQLLLVAGDVAAASALVDEAEMIGRAAGSTNAAVLATVMRLMMTWHRGEYDAAVARVESLDEVAPSLAMYVSAIGSYARAYQLAGRTVAAMDLLDRAAALGLHTQPVDAEWLANLVNLTRAAAALGHPILDDALTLIAPHADLVVFEGIGAGLYGSVARIVAVGCTAIGRHDDAVRYAEQALAMNRRFGGVLVADALRTLAGSLDGRDGPGSARAASLHRDADLAYRAAGAPHMARPAATTIDSEPAPTPSTSNELRREGDVWRITYAGRATIVRHVKGIADLAVLVERPGREVHVTELDGGAAVPLGGRGGDALDRRAIDEYRARLTELAGEIDEAEASHDIGRAERARLEYDALVDQLTGAVGIGGRVRGAGVDPVERLRKAVTARLRDAIRRIDTVDPLLGRHLGNAVHTGTYCSYRPESPTLWRCRAT